MSSHDPDPAPAPDDAAGPEAGADDAWTVYVLVSESDGRTYVGLARDIDARLEQHNGKARGGAKSTRGSRPWRVAKTYGPYASRGEATRVEHLVKRRRGRERLDWAPEGDDGTA